MATRDIWRLLGILAIAGLLALFSNWTLSRMAGAARRHLP